MEERRGESNRRGIAGSIERGERLGTRHRTPRFVAGPLGQQRPNRTDPQLGSRLEKAGAERVVEIRGKERGERGLEGLPGGAGIARFDRLPRSVDATAQRRLAPGAEDVEGQGPDRRRRIGAGGKRHEALGIGLRPRCLGRSDRPAQKSLVERSGGNSRRELAPGPGQREIVDRPGRFGGDPRVGIVEESSHDVAATAPQRDHRRQTDPRRRIGGESREAHRVAHTGKPHHDRMAVMGIGRRRVVGCGSQAPRGDRIRAALPADSAEGNGRSRTDLEVMIVEQADELRPVGLIDCGTAIAELPRGHHADLPRRVAEQRGKRKDHKSREQGTSCHLGEPLDGMDTR